MTAWTEVVDEVDLPFEEFSKWDGIELEALCFLAVHCIGVALCFPGVIGDFNNASF